MIFSVFIIFYMKCKLLLNKIVSIITQKFLIKHIYKYKFYQCLYNLTKLVNKTPKIDFFKPSNTYKI